MSVCLPQARRMGSANFEKPQSVPETHAVLEAAGLGTPPAFERSRPGSLKVKFPLSSGHTSGASTPDDSSAIMTHHPGLQRQGTDDSSKTQSLELPRSWVIQPGTDVFVHDADVAEDVQMTSQSSTGTVYCGVPDGQYIRRKMTRQTTPERHHQPHHSKRSKRHAKAQVMQQEPTAVRWPFPTARITCMQALLLKRSDLAKPVMGHCHMHLLSLNIFSEASAAACLGHALQC